MLRLIGYKAFVNGSHCSKLQVDKRALAILLFINHLGLRIILFTNLQIWKKGYKKEINVLQILGFRNSKT